MVGEGGGWVGWTGGGWTAAREPLHAANETVPGGGTAHGLRPIHFLRVCDNGNREPRRVSDNCRWAVADHSGRAMAMRAEAALLETASLDGFAVARSAGATAEP